MGLLLASPLNPLRLLDGGRKLQDLGRSRTVNIKHPLQFMPCVAFVEGEK
jgi:hypothetical protein